jgi:hypothetical protein
MTIFVSISPACEQQATHHGRLTEVQKIAADIERKQSIDNLDKHLPSPIIEKVIGRSYRLYGIEILHDSGEHRVIRFSKFFAKGPNENFHRELEDERVQDHFIKDSSLPQAQLDKFVTERIAAGVKGRNAVSQAEQQYLEISREMLHQNEPRIFENRDWIDFLKPQEAREFLWPLAQQLMQLVGEQAPEERQQRTRFPANEPRAILYRQFNNGLFLIAPIGLPGVPAEEELRTRYAELLSSDENLAEEELRKNSLRTYPESVAWIEETWIAVQKGDKDANLSLSPEESDLLHSILTPGQKHHKYPLFINGRPGSGKTTILQYLFSDLIDHHLQTSQPLSDPPIYLTYSPSLMERAKKTVDNILTCDYKRLQESTSRAIQTKVGRETFNRAFNSFRGLLLSELDEATRARFAPQCYVDFPEFKKLWAKSVAQNSTISTDLRKSPELAWHAIRTFIKGRRPPDGLEEDFHPERYAELPKRQKSIDEGIYADIYQKIWHGWYRRKCNEESLWDDQDLAFEVLRLEDRISRYPAIVCDEAQDFTANELAVILRLSLFSARTVPHYLLSRIPFAFAGDPFQTLNPTGFDWNALSDGFRENILRELDPLGKHQLQVNFQELEYNYRSAEPIVRLCNLVQLIRGVMFDIGGLKPQQTWRITPAAGPVFFDIGEANTREALKTEDNLVIIVPSQEESEHEFAAADEHLKVIAFKNGTLVRDVFNPMRAKGMEFQRVALYKFGDYCLTHHPELADLLAKPTPQEKKDRDRLAYEYFINRLYVALSRARSRLLIVDTREAIERFWGFARGSGYDALIKQYKAQKDTWTNANLGLITAGETTSWSEAADNPLELASQFFENGLDDRDPYTLDRAQQRFAAAGAERDALKAKAWACHFREQYALAGKTFEEIGDVTDALNNYWLGDEYKAYVTLAERKNVSPTAHYLAARYMGGQHQEVDAAKFFADLHDLLQKTTEQEDHIDIGGAKALDAAFEVLLADVDNSSRQPSAIAASLKAVAGITQRIRWTPKPSLSYAVFLSIGNEDARAVAVWDELKRQPAEIPSVLLSSLANTKPFPDNIPYLLRQNSVERIVSEMQSADTARLSVKTIIEITTRIVELDRPDLVEAVALALPPQKAFVCLDGMTHEYLDRLSSAELVTRLLSQLAATEKWKLLFDCLLKGQAPDLSKERQTWLTTFVDSATNTHEEIIRILARADGLRGDHAAETNVSTYFDRLLKRKTAALSNVSPFEVGAAIEMSGMFALAQRFYDLLLGSTDRTTDPELLTFARERWLMSQIGLIGVMRTRERSRKSIEDKYKKSARTWGIEWAKLPRYINLHQYEEAIARFYSERAAVKGAATGGVPGKLPPPTIAQPDATKPVSPLPDETVSPELPITEVKPAPQPEPAPTSVIEPNLDVEPVAEAPAIAERQDDTITILSSGSQWKVACYYVQRRVEIRNLVTKETVVARVQGGKFSVRSPDFDIDRNGQKFVLADWPIGLSLLAHDPEHSQLEIECRPNGTVLRVVI